MIFKRKYSKLSANETKWTKNLLVSRIYNELNGLGSLHRDVIKINVDSKYEVYLYFTASNYPEKNVLSLSCSIEVGLTNKNGTKFWDDLRSVSRNYFKKNISYLEIHQDEKFKGSNLHKECNGIYLTFIKLVNNIDELESMLKGNNFVINGKSQQLRDISQYLNHLKSKV